MGNACKTVPVKKLSKNIFKGIGVVIVLSSVFLLVSCNSNQKTSTPSQGGDITITKSEITETAKFFPYKSGNINMELLAVKAPDGTIRTAFNTCQVCSNSGKGYYKQVGDELVCQNCGNRFKISQIEKEKNGCNPVPILEENKSDSGTAITISKSFLEQNVKLFGNWKKG